MMKKYNPLLKIRKASQGFTIVELMVALTVLSVLLLMSSIVLIHIGGMYSKGVNMAAIQSANRNLMTDIGSALQFSDQTPVFNSATYSGVQVHSFCLDTKRYSYILNSQLSDNPNSPSAPATGNPQAYHAMWEDTMQSNAGCLPLDITQAGDPGNSVPGGVIPPVAGSGRELIPAHSRLSFFCVTGDPSCGPGGLPGSGIYTITVTIAYGDNDLLDATGTQCKGGTGQEYCATSNFSTVVTRRLK